MTLFLLVSVSIIIVLLSLCPFTHPLLSPFLFSQRISAPIFISQFQSGEKSLKQKWRERGHTHTATSKGQAKQAVADQYEHNRINHTYSILSTVSTSSYYYDIVSYPSTTSKYILHKRLRLFPKLTKFIVGLIERK